MFTSIEVNWNILIRNNYIFRNWDIKFPLFFDTGRFQQVSFHYLNINNSGAIDVESVEFMFE